MINAINGSGSRTILLSKRANIFYIERAKVMVFNERVIYRKEYEEEILDFNIPDCNTSYLLLGKGTSITDTAIRYLAKSGVIVGFSGSGGTPLHACVDFVFLNPMDEYRPTEYCQKWCEKWFIQEEKIKLAIKMQELRTNNLIKYWNNNVFILSNKIKISDEVYKNYINRLKSAKNETELLTNEGVMTKSLYSSLKNGLNIDFKRYPGSNKINSFLDHGNYLMYGCASVALHALGIPAAFPLLHGKTNRGGLVFDVADIFKDSIVLPLAFEIGINNKSKDQDFRILLIEKIQKEEIIDKMIASLKYLLNVENRYFD